MATLATAACAIALGLSSPAAAVTYINTVPATATHCDTIGFTGISATSCDGGYIGNLLQGTLQDPGLAALQALGYSGTGTYLQKLDSLSGNTIDFTTLLTGVTYIGIHYGGGGVGDNQEATSFFKFDAGAGVDSFTFNRNGLSNAVLFQTGGVPEPATWALMLVGFAGMGTALRRSRKMNGGLPQIA